MKQGLGDEVDSGVPLTPAQFLCSQPVRVHISGLCEHPVTAKYFVVRNKVTNQLLDRFWETWSCD